MVLSNCNWYFSWLSSTVMIKFSGYKVNSPMKYFIVVISDVWLWQFRKSYFIEIVYSSHHCFIQFQINLHLWSIMLTSHSTEEIKRKGKPTKTSCWFFDQSSLQAFSLVLKGIYEWRRYSSIGTLYRTIFQTWTSWSGNKTNENALELV